MTTTNRNIEQMQQLPVSQNFSATKKKNCVQSDFLRKTSMGLNSILNYFSSIGQSCFAFSNYP